MDPIEELRSYWLSEIHRQYHNALNFHELHLLELSNLQLRPPEGVDSYQDQQSRATINAAQVYLNQINLIQIELGKLTVLKKGITRKAPEIETVVDWSGKINASIEEIKARVETLWGNRIYTVLQAENARRRSKAQS